MIQPFAALRLAMVSGKGGVGKTTLACGWARQWAQQFPGETILLLSTDPAHSLGDVLQLSVSDAAQPCPDLPNLQVRSLDANRLLQAFKAVHGKILEQLVERGSFVQAADLSPVWDLSWPGLDELMGILEIQRILQNQIVDRVVVDMAPSGHTLNLFGLMDFLDEFLAALELFQEKHRTVSQSLTGRYMPDAADRFLQEMKTDLAGGRHLLQDAQQTACLVVAIAEPMSLLETQRFLAALDRLHIPVGGLLINRILSGGSADRLTEQHHLLTKFSLVAAVKPVFTVALQANEPIGATAIDQMFSQIQPAQLPPLPELPAMQLPVKLLPSLNDFVAAGRRLILVGGKGGVGKTTVAAAIAWGMAARHLDRQIRVISIDPAHSLGDAFGHLLGHEPSQITTNLSAQEVDANQVLAQFRQDYLWELAAMMSGESGDASLRLAYGPEAWRKIVTQSLPGIDEMLSLITVMELLESNAQDLIILDTAPTGHLLRFLEMPIALSDWLSWIFKLWLKYQTVVGRTEFMGRLRILRQRVLQAQKKLQDPLYTEFIGVVQAQSAILAESQRLTRSLQALGVAQRYVVQNRFESEPVAAVELFSEQTLIRLPSLPRSLVPLEQIQVAANLLF